MSRLHRSNPAVSSSSAHPARPIHSPIPERAMEPAAAAALLLSPADAVAVAVAAGRCRPSRPLFAAPGRRAVSCRSVVRARAAAAMSPAAENMHGVGNNGGYTVGDFMTKKEKLHVVKPSTSVDEALEMLVQHRISGFPVIDDNWKLVGVVSDYDLLALDSMSGGLADTSASMFPEVDSTWKTFREIQRLLSKTNGKVIGDVMTSSPLVVRENTNLDAATRLLLETKHSKLPVVDSTGKLVGMITRGNVVRAALTIKKEAEEGASTV